MNIERWVGLVEGQFFERKSALDRSDSKVKRRGAKEITWDIVETLSAMANADGGELVLGIEDDGAITGVPHTSDKIALFLRAAQERNYVDPPLHMQADVIQTSGGTQLIHFSVDWSPNVHRLADGRYLLRVNDTNAPFPADQIAALKATKAQGLFERSFPPDATIDDINLGMVSTLLMPAGENESAEGILKRYRLLDDRSGRAVPCLAALLLFGNDPLRWHPRCGIDFVRWAGTERMHGEEFNAEKRIRIEEPLGILIEKAYDAIRPFIRERQYLHDLFFTEKLEYPTSVWQEAIVNAVAHREYSIQGTSIEIWMFDDRIEVRSPGLPPQPVTVEALNRRENLHVSRNPIIVRVLRDLGYMRESGEGIPRMFSEMERQGFYPPRFEIVGEMSFQAALRNQPIYDLETIRWLRQFEHLDLSGNQKRLLVYAYAHGNRFTNRDYQTLTGLDLYGASNSIKELIRKGCAQSTGKGSRIYEVIDSFEARPAMPSELTQLLPRLETQIAISNEDIREILGISRAAATRLAQDLAATGWLERKGAGRWTRYTFLNRLIHQPHHASEIDKNDA